MSAEVHPWQSARDRFDQETLPLLRRIGHKIGEAAENGDKNAAEVITCYKLLHRSFDPMTAIRLEEALKLYLQTYE